LNFTSLTASDTSFFWKLSCTSNILCNYLLNCSSCSFILSLMSLK
jgi:hypothetical protein